MPSSASCPLQGDPQSHSGRTPSHSLRHLDLLTCTERTPSWRLVPGSTVWQIVRAGAHLPWRAAPVLTHGVSMPGSVGDAPQTHIVGKNIALLFFLMSRRVFVTLPFFDQFMTTGDMLKYFGILFWLALFYKTALFEVSALLNDK